MSDKSFDVAPHGLLLMAALAFFFVFLVHMLGFSVVGAIRVGR